jgi:hypothetical protein
MSNRSLHFIPLPPTRSRSVLALLLLLLLGLAGGALADEDRSNYGTTHYPIWSELSYFERATLGDLHLAGRDDPDALLALYLVASGVRDFADYESVKTRIAQFRKQIDKLIVERKNDWLIGQLLNIEMHNTFFLKESRGGAPNGYSTDQSRLMGIFETGEFNCISASLLYAILARHYNLRVQGVLLPSHAFIQLDLRDGRKIDVETTSPNGYDQLHDEAFYERNNNDWFTSRSLQPATYQDYLKRERISATHLAARNMLNQHTISSRMDEKDSLRLAEISAFIDPSNPMAQEKRLYFYNREIHALAIQQDWKTLKRLFDVTYATVMQDSQRHLTVTGLQSSLKMYMSGAMLTYAQLGDTEQTLAIMGDLLSRGLAAGQERAALEQRVINAVSVLMTKLAELKRFDDGLLVLSLTEGHLSDPRAWPDMVNWFYLRWAEYQWEEKNWQEVVTILADYLNQPSEAVKDPKHPREIIGSAYNNWVLELVEARDLAQAESITADCQQRFSGDICSRAQKVLDQGRKQQKSSLRSS